MTRKRAVGITLGTRLKIRAMARLAAQPIPLLRPMRTFIHHNPLHGLQDMPFADALTAGARLFRARPAAPRRVYQQYLRAGEMHRATLDAALAQFAAEHVHEYPRGIDLRRWLAALLYETTQTGVATDTLARPTDTHAALHGRPPPEGEQDPRPALRERLRAELLHGRPLYEVTDALFGTDIGGELDEWVIKVCLGFCDEGQSVWAMPRRELGLFAAWRHIAGRAPRFLPSFVGPGAHVRRVLNAADSAEGVIAEVLRRFGVGQAQWQQCFTREFSRLYGWTGFIRWRAGARRYYWARRHPADLIDFLALRLSLAWALLQARKPRRFAATVAGVEAAIERDTARTYLRYALHGKTVLPRWAHRIERVLAIDGGGEGNQRRIDALLPEYLAAKRAADAERQAARLVEVARLSGDAEALRRLSAAQLARLQTVLARFERQEGMLWLRALEQKAMDDLVGSLSPAAPPKGPAGKDAPPKRPFTQALFCIDPRSERIRRHLERVGDYQTFGIAGFFGVPVSFMPYGKGSETHLCPVLVTPKNLVPEIALAEARDDSITAAEKTVRELKESVLAPFVTVEAIGLLFGLDMAGKTLAPQTYSRWRQRMRPQTPATRLLVDKLSQHQADSIVRATQRAVIEQALAREFGLQPETITDAVIRDLREAALDMNGAGVKEPDGQAPGANEPGAKAPGQDRVESCSRALRLDGEQTRAFIERLRADYRINRDFARRQIERLGRIGFTEDEQVNYVGAALRGIGLAQNFSRFVLIVGHGGSSENNPYESALDCGACGGNHGLASARVFAQMANKPRVRRKLAEQGIAIPDDTWFIPALHNTTTDALSLHDLALLPPSHLVYLDRLKHGLLAASRLCARERMPQLALFKRPPADAAKAAAMARRRALDWSQVRPEWGLARNTWFVIGGRRLTAASALHGRAFLHSYDYRLDPRRRLLENILTGPLLVGHWISMEHYFSGLDNERYGSGSKVNHNVAGRFGVMSGNLSDLRIGLPAQAVLKDGVPYHRPTRLITLIEAPVAHAKQAIEGVVAVKKLVYHGWLRMLILDPRDGALSVFADGQWCQAGRVSPR